MLVVAAAGAAVAAASGTGHPPGLVRHRTLASPAISRAGPPQDRPGPVVLVPGYGGETGSLDELASRIRASGRQAIVLRLPGTGTGSLVADAALLNAAVERALRRGAPSVDVIGYSAGGVVALLWARRDDGAARARRVITLGAPFHGTQLAAAAAGARAGRVPGRLPPARPWQLCARQPRRGKPSRAASVAVAVDHRRPRRHAA